VSRNRLVLTAIVASIVSFGFGYVLGASGRFSIQNALDQVQQQLDLAQARGAILEARVSLYNVNFGDAAQHFDQAKAPLRRAQQRYQQVGNNAAAGSIAAALAHVEEGQRLAGALDQSANGKANDALEAIKVATAR
jgi:C4-dicarboxylate-specific signal transduction histidine kinase